MSSNNKLLKNISSNFGVEVDDRIQYDNYYLKKIANQTGSTVSGHKSDNFLLKEIANNTKNLSVEEAEASARISELEGTVVSLNGQIGTLNDEVSSLNGEIDTLESTITSLNGQIGELNGQISGLEDDIEDLEYARDNNVVLFLDKSIVQTNGIVNVGAIVKKAGNRLNGQLVNFYAEE